MKNIFRPVDDVIYKTIAWKNDQLDLRTNSTYKDPVSFISSFPYLEYFYTPFSTAIKR